MVTTSLINSENEQIIEIVETLNSAFSNRTINRAVLSEIELGFKSTIDDFENIDLLTVSQLLCTNLYQQIFNLSSAKGGYLVFTLYRVASHNYLGVFFVRKTTGSNIEFQNPNNSWDLELVRYLDVKHFAMGVRINISNLLNNPDSRYLQLVKGNTNVSDYFTNWIGISNPVSENIDAGNLFEIINNIELDEGVDRDEVKRQVYNYAKNQSNRLVNIRSLSEYVFEDPNKIIDYCDSQNIEISHEFKLKGKFLNKFYKITAQADGIWIQANYDKFNEEDIRILDDNETILIKSQDLVRIINEQKHRSTDYDD
ncbi:Nucleoid-associated protein YejK [Psychrobacter sp. LV10R520-6]|nr:Nucleoid-associated protein YejK [Psychrobacter sp. LV10R520-6]